MTDDTPSTAMTADEFERHAHQPETVGHLLAVPNTAIERLSALEAHVAVQDRVIEALRDEIGGLRTLIRLRVPETEQQFAHRLKLMRDGCV